MKRRQYAYKLSYASPEQPALIHLKFDGDSRLLYDLIDREARRRNVSRQSVIVEAVIAKLKEGRHSASESSFRFPVEADG